jgi:hypothetical protein
MRLEFFPDRPVNQFPGGLKDENSVVISDEFTGSVNYLMGLAEAAGSGGVFYTHRMRIENLSGIYHGWPGKEWGGPQRGTCCNKIAERVFT